MDDVRRTSYVVLILMVVVASLITNVKCQICTNNGVQTSCLFTQNGTWTTPPYVSSILISLWGGGGGGSGSTFLAYFGTDVVDAPDYSYYDSFGTFSSGGGSGSAIINFPLSWRTGSTQSVSVVIGQGGSGGGTSSSSVNGGPGGTTTVTVGPSTTLYAYGGGGGGTTGGSFGDAYGGGGGGSYGPASSDSGSGGPACTSSDTSTACPLGTGPAGANSPDQAMLTSSDAQIASCSAPAGTTSGYWASGGSGSICDMTYFDLMYQPVACSTSNWAGPCLDTTTNCNGNSASASVFTLQIPISGTGYNYYYATSCVGAGAPGPYGSSAAVNNSGAGGSGCPLTTSYTVGASDGQKDLHCVGEAGAAGGVMITYTNPSRAFTISPKNNQNPEYTTTDDIHIRVL